MLRQSLQLTCCILLLSGCHDRHEHLYPNSVVVFETYDNQTHRTEIAATSQEATSQVGAWYAQHFAGLTLQEDLGKPDCFRRTWRENGTQTSFTLTACDHDGLHTLWLKQATER